MKPLNAGRAWRQALVASLSLGALCVAHAQSPVSTFGYDPNGNRQTQTDALSRSTGFQYDSLDRLKQLTDPANGVTAYTYSGQGRITSATDPRNVVTTYTINGLGSVTQEASPDRGTSSETFDAAGNMLTSVDGRGKTTTYTYDALDRMLSMSFQDGASVTFGYDQGANAKGRLSSVTWPGGLTSYGYGASGRVVQKTDAHTSGPTLTVIYAWDPITARLNALTYPSGRTITYAYDASGRVLTLAAGASPIAVNISYFPFGAAASWSWGNGTVVTRSFDADGRLSALTLGSAGTRQVIYDAASRITGLTDPLNTVNNQTYGYDALDRVTSWMDSGSARAYTYDAAGNRTSLSIAGNFYATTVAPNSNRVTSTDGPAPARTFTYDGAGNIVGNGQSSFTYNDRGRLSSANGASYVYDGPGQRVKKSGSTAIVPSGTNYFVYDESGKLLGEYDATGAAISEYAYLDDQLIAVMRGPAAATEVFNVYTDQVGRPWVITDATDQPRWRWDTSPFGEFGPNDNPAGVGAFTFNVRFPGQYYDAESGLFYNYFRDYDPQTGRYVQSDPIGLRGGLNTYSYVGGNPISLRDPRGLVPSWIAPEAPLILTLAHVSEMATPLFMAGAAAAAGYGYGQVINYYCGGNCFPNAGGNLYDWLHPQPPLTTPISPKISPVNACTPSSITP